MFYQQGWQDRPRACATPLRFARPKVQSSQRIVVRMARAALSIAFLLVAAGCALGAEHARKVLQTSASTPVYAPAPVIAVNGASGYSCPSPGSTGYLFQQAPCAYGTYRGQSVYCDEAQGGMGIVGIRNETGTRCTMTSGCGTGQFCNAHYSPSRCSAVATSSCFAGAPAPGPAPST